MSIILGFGECNFDQTMSRAKELAVILLEQGREAMMNRADELKPDDPLAGLWCNGFLPRKDVAVVSLTEMHVNRNHPFSPDGVAGIRVRAMAVAINTFGKTEVSCGITEESTAEVEAAI